jgi:hypothetical protein
MLKSWKMVRVEDESPMKLSGKVAVLLNRMDVRPPDVLILQQQTESVHLLMYTAKIPENFLD